MERERLEIRFTDEARQGLPDLLWYDVTEEDLRRMIEDLDVREPPPGDPETVEGVAIRLRVRVVYVRRPDYYLVTEAHIIRFRDG